MKKKNPYFSVFLLFLVILISFRFLFFISYVRLQKTEFRRQLIPNKTSQVIEFEFEKTNLYKDKNGFEWKDKNKELVVKGVYHEVLGILEKNGHSIVLAVPDHAENILFQKYFSIHKSLRENDLTVLTQFLNLTYLNTRFSFEPKLVVMEIKQDQKSVTFNTNCYAHKIIQPPEA